MLATIRTGDIIVTALTVIPEPAKATTLELWKLVFDPSISTLRVLPCGPSPGVTRPTAGTAEETAKLVPVLTNR